MVKRIDRTSLRPVGSCGRAAEACAAAPPRAGRRARSRADKLSFPLLVWIFALCSVVGLVVETLVSYPVDGVWKDRAGLLWGPFSPIYGVGGVLMTVALNRLADARPVTLFAAAALVGATFECAAGWFWKHAFGIVAWSYADQPFNVGGYTCLGMALVWGAAGLAWMRLGLPRVVRLFDRIPVPARRPLASLLFAFLVVDAIMTVVAFGCWFDRQAGLPAEGPVSAYFAERYDDAFMAERFQTMSIYPDLAHRP